MPPGASTLTVTATAPDGATAFAQTTVIFDVVPGTLLFAASDPDGDDNGPGTYDYPNSANFVDGAYDLQAFEVYDSGPDTVTFRVQTRDLTPTFGSPLGAQLVDVYLRDPAATTTSTAASFAQRNYTIDPEAAWSRLIEVQGFGQRFIDASGATVGTVAIRGTQVTRWITFTVTKAALGGTPGAGWSFAVVLTGQDGFSTDQARGFQPQSRGLPVRCLHTRGSRRRQPDLRRRSEHRPQGDGHPHAGGDDTGGRPEPVGPTGRHPGGDDPVTHQPPQPC